MAKEELKKLLSKARGLREAEVLSFINSGNESHYDVQFLAGENRILLCGFRLSLASISPVFHAMFHGQMKESSKEVIIQVPDIDPTALQCIIQFSVGIDPVIDEYNCVAVKKVAQKYQIESLNPLLDDFILSCINEKNFCRIFNEIILAPVPSLVSYCINGLQHLHNFDGLLSSQDFLNLSVSAMEMLVGSEYLSCSEETIWESCVRWANYKAKSGCFSDNQLPGKRAKIHENHDFIATTKTYLDQIKSGIRFTWMTPEFIMQKVHPEKVLSDSDIVSLFSNFHCPSERVLTAFPSTLRRSFIPSSFLVYGAGVSFVNGRYEVEFKGGESGKSAYYMLKPVYIRVAQDKSKFAIYYYEPGRKWYISKYERDNFWLNGSFPNGGDDLYKVDDTDSQTPPTSSWVPILKENAPSPKLHPLGPCFSSNSFQR